MSSHNIKETLKHNAAVLLVLGAVGVSYAVGREDSQRRDRNGRLDAISACLRSSHRVAIQAAAWSDASQARQLEGDFETGVNYRAFADSLIETIPAPRGFEGLRVLAEVRQIKGRFGEQQYVLSPQASRLQRQGCEESFRPI